MILRELSKEEFKKFSDKCSCKNFFQTTMTYDSLKSEGVEVYLLGLLDGKKIVAATLVACNSLFMGKKSFEAYKGFLIDYQNKKLVSEFSNKVKAFLKEKGGYKLVIDPYIPNISRDSDANIIDGVDNTHVKKYLQQIGYTYLGETTQVKWTYCLDVERKSCEEIFSDMRSSTKNYINRTINKYKLNIRTLSRDELTQFKKITEDTCERRSFADKTLEYYESMFDNFKEDVVFKICELDCDKYINTLIEENKTYETKLKKLSDSKQKKKETMQEEYENNKRKITEIKQLKAERGNILPLSGAMFMLYGDETVYLFGGSYAEYMNFCGQYALQWDIIKYGCENNFKRHNFYGINDVFNKEGKNHGIYYFKQGFGGYVEELLGSFEIGICATYNLYKFLKKVEKLFRR